MKTNDLGIPEIFKEAVTKILSGENMKIAKITVLAVILLATVGMVAAVDIGNLKVSDGFENLGEGSYSNEADNIEIDVFNGSDIADFFESDDEVNYTVVEGAINNTFNFTDGINEEIGVVELVKADEEYLAVTFWCDYNGTVIGLEKMNTAMEEFNKLNNFTPLDAEVLND